MKIREDSDEENSNKENWVQSISDEKKYYSWSISKDYKIFI